MNLLIAITGRAGSGKTTLSEMVSDRLGYERLAFSDPMKQGLDAMLGLNGKWDCQKWKATEIPGLGVTPRALLQTLGTEWGRSMINPAIWVFAVRQKIEAALERGAPGVVLHDLRFNNEAKMVHEMGGLVIEVNRPGAAPATSGRDALHESENGISPHLLDGVVINSTNPGAMFDTLRVIMAGQHPLARSTGTFAPRVNL